MIEDFTTEELREIPNTIAVTRQISETHFGLGLRGAFMMTANVGNMGVLQAGNLGTGKTKTLKVIANIKFRKMFTRKFTMAGVKASFNKYFSNSEVSWINYELADMSEIVIENMMKVVCDILTDHECVHSTRHYDCNIVNSTISWLGACTFPIYNKLWKIVAWRGNFKDRILTYIVLPYRKRVNTSDPHAVLTMNFPKPEDITVNTSYFSEIVKMFEKQFTDERAFEYAERMLKGSAALNHRHEALDSDAKFLLLSKPNIEGIGWVAHRESLSSPLEIESDALIIFAEALKSTGTPIERFLDAPHYLESTDSIVRCIHKHPELFKKIGDTVFPKARVVAEEITPQVKFEEMCLRHGKNHYRGLN